MNNPPGKLCPRCQTLTGLASPSCLSCGHVYRTRFTPPAPAPPTQMYPPPASVYAPPPAPFPSPPAKPKRPPLYAFFVIVGGLFAFGVIGTCAASLSGKTEEGRPASAADPIHGAFTNPSGWNISQRVQPGMGLNDVLDIGGGVGNITGGGRPNDWLRMEYPGIGGTAVVLFSFHGMVDTQINGHASQMPIWTVEQVSLLPGESQR